MRKDQFARQWPEIRMRVQAHWSRLTKEDLDQVEGSADILIGTIEEKYGEPRQAIEVQLDRFLTSAVQTSSPH